MKQVFAALCFSLIPFINCLAQEHLVKGKVSEEHSGRPLQGVRVNIKDSKHSALTDLGGNYQLLVPNENSVLIYSSIGYEKQEVSLRGRSILDVFLKQSNQTLDEVMVVAYGTVRKESFTGSVSEVRSETFENRPITSFEKALQGAASGVQVTSVSGQPGSSSTVRIRGVGSFNASSTPLYVLDGVAITNGNMSYMAQSDVTYTGDVLSSLNPNDIESVTVLKDASASAIYGSRAANGVILINTKKGKAGKTNFSARSNAGYSSEAVSKHAVLNGAEYYKLYWDYYYKQRRALNDSETDAVSFANKQTNKTLFGSETKSNYNTTSPYVANGVLAENARLYYDTDWRKEVLRRGLTKNIDISAEGGAEKIKFFVSGGYFSQDGIVLGSDFKRYSGRFNISNDVSDNFTVGITNHLSYTDQNTPAGGTGAANPVRFGDLVSNIYPLYALDSNGEPLINSITGQREYNYSNPLTNDYNPLALNELDEYNTRTARVITSPFAELKILKTLKARSTVGIDYIANRERQFYNMQHGNGTGVRGRGYRFSREDITLTFINTLNYNKTFGEHSVDVLLGQEAYKTKRDNTYSQATNFAFPGADELIGASIPSIARSFLSEQKFESYFTRLNYSYKNRYYISGSFRRDGSSVFGPGFKFGNFYSIGGAWRLSQENFLSEIEFLDELKLKASYGVSGNDRLGVDNNRSLENRYAWQALYSLGKNYEGQTGMNFSQLENRDLHWEKTRSTDIGLEVSFLKNRISAEISYYNRGSDELLFQKPLSKLTGFDYINSNLGAMDNRGFEIFLKSKPLGSKELDWTTSFNLTSNKNTIRRMTQNEIIENGTSKRWTVGEDRYQWYIREYAGIDPQTGRPLWYVDELGTDGKPNGNRLTTSNPSLATQYGGQGSSLPKVTGGFNNTFRYENFDLNIFTYFSAGNKIYDSLYSLLMHGGETSGTQMSRDILNAWKNPGDITDVPRFAVTNTDLGNYTSSRFLVDGSYIRVKNLTLGYSLNQRLLRSAKLSSARIYLMAENPFTLAKHKGMDPEIENSGISSSDVPNIKTISLGINIGL
ncbi:SusC/RagA family TonB-linked outer membrane protein [Desertivirga xinjiangensis]|uniref:SusC/RagA family TonB-linked outer membrane protein n=1 Tax=Desertivirga xinjiangensis TaxID=539206 RepID=UPI00210C43AE|nr:TonB-dependent receptor [Pedobacter xinjiangensis]